MSKNCGNRENLNFTIYLERAQMQLNGISDYAWVIELQQSWQWPADCVQNGVGTDLKLFGWLDACTSGRAAGDFRALAYVQVSDLVRELTSSYKL